MYYGYFGGPNLYKWWTSRKKLNALIRRNTINRIALESMGFDEIHHLIPEQGHRKKDGSWLPCEDYDYLYKIACQNIRDGLDLQRYTAWLFGVGMVIFCIILRQIL